jgi:hypothetical protein
VSILSRSFTSRCTRKRANSTNLARNYREKVEGKHFGPLQFAGRGERAGTREREYLAVGDFPAAAIRAARLGRWLL